MYELFVVLSTTEGFHVPITPFVDVPDNVGTVEPIQIDWKFPKLKAGVRIGLTVTVKINGVTHCPAAAVNI